jgi:hypothetical protein
MIALVMRHAASVDTGLHPVTTTALHVRIQILKLSLFILMELDIVFQMVMPQENAVSVEVAAKTQ